MLKKNHCIIFWIYFSKYNIIIRLCCLCGFIVLILFSLSCSDLFTFLHVANKLCFSHWSCLNTFISLILGDLNLLIDFFGKYNPRSNTIFLKLSKILIFFINPCPKISHFSVDLSDRLIVKFSLICSGACDIIKFTLNFKKRFTFCFDSKKYYEQYIDTWR